MAQHAILAPSGAEKWMSCAGAPSMERGLPDEANEYSDEGTAAHLLASTILESLSDPYAFIGRTIHVGANDEFDGAVWDEDIKDDFYEGFVVRRTYTVDEEMASHVAKFTDRILEYAAPDGIFQAEQRISISKFTGEPDAAGTSDAVVIRDGELQVHDLKYGMGVRVYAKENKQLLIYALGVREEMELAYGPFKRIHLVIHQPRLDHLDEWDCSNEELDAFALEVEGRAARALKLYNEGAQPDDLRPSEDACRWCKAKASCPQLAKFVQDKMAMDFEAMTGPPEHNAHAENLLMAQATPAALAQKMAACGLIEDWIKAVRAKVESELFKGVAIPGWKIVQGKKGGRQWVDIEKADTLFKSMRLKMEERYDMKLKSPPAMEKFLKDTPKRWNRVLKDGLIVQKEGQPSVAPESDKRPTWTPPDSSNDFTATEA